MNKIKKASNPKNQEINFSLITLVLVVFCFFLIVIVTFTELKVFIISNWELKQINYIPQIPIILFISGLLGKKYGTLSVLLYILTGLFLVPVFALGGGLDYILNFNFGYILGFIPGVYFSAKIIEEKTTLLRLFLANILGITCIHVLGIFYLTVIFLINHENINTIFNWISAQSFNNLQVDFILGLAAIIFGNFIKIILKKIA